MQNPAQPLQKVKAVVDTGTFEQLVVEERIVGTSHIVENVIEV
jgi:glutaredoxin-related protein